MGKRSALLLEKPDNKPRKQTFTAKVKQPNNHHCPICHRIPTQKCYDAQHLANCPRCDYPNACPVSPETCPRCRAALEREYQRQKKIREEDEKREKEEKERVWWEEGMKRRKPRWKGKVKDDQSETELVDVKTEGDGQKRKMKGMD